MNESRKCWSAQQQLCIAARASLFLDSSTFQYLYTAVSPQQQLHLSSLPTHFQISLASSGSISIGMGQMGPSYQKNIPTAWCFTWSHLCPSSSSSFRSAQTIIISYKWITQKHSEYIFQWVSSVIFLVHNYKLLVVMTASLQSANYLILWTCHKCSFSVRSFF